MTLPWTTPIKVIQMIFEENWLSDTINNYLESANAGIYTAAMTGDVKESVRQINYGDDEGRPFPSLVAINKTTGEVITGREAKTRRNELEGE